MTELSADHDVILSTERRALDHWAGGNPSAYFEGWADDVTYFDDLGAQRRIDGIAALRDYAASLGGKVPAHRYELVEPKVQVYGETGIVTLQYVPFAADGSRSGRRPWSTGASAMSGGSCTDTGRW